MWTDSQISSYLVPIEIWQGGHLARRDLLPLAVPARDAFDIERRGFKGVNIRNESRRYSLCCQRMQGIALELSQAGLLPAQPVVWPTFRDSAGLRPPARAYIQVTETSLAAISRLLRKQPDLRNQLYLRVSTIFFPPSDAQAHLRMLDMVLRQPNLNELCDIAAKEASLPESPFQITSVQCRDSLVQRRQLLATALETTSGIVDVLELV